MPLEINARPPSASEARGRWGRILVAMVLVLAAGLGAWGAGVRPASLWSSPPPPLATLEVDRGDVELVVTENGSLESANNATVRCQVEALIGTVGGTQAAGQGGAQGGSGSQGGSTTGGTGTGTGTGTGGASAQGGAATTSTSAAATAKTKAKPKPGARATTTTSKSGTATSGSTSSAGASQSASTGASSSSSATSTAGASGSSTTAATRPTIRSFTYEVVPHVPLRPKTTTTVQQTKATSPANAQPSGGGGGRGGRGGGGGQNAAETEKPGSTRIISILPEGTRVKAGDVVCRLDASAFEDALQAQEIRHAQAKAWVDQAQAILEVTEITLNEYRDGIFPQDKQLIRHYVETCRLEDERARKNLEWSQKAIQKGVRSSQQFRADILSLQRAELALREAEGMAYRLEHYTGPKLIKSLEAKLEAIRADKLTQQSSFQLEDERLKKLQRMVDNCTMKAPRDGIVVYANLANNWGQVNVQIDEGVTVREGQPIFQLPDPKHMQVKVRVNESKVALIRPGEPALIRIDAFPNQPLNGIVTELTAIPAPANRASPDIKVYFATVKLETGGFDALRPGLSAEVTFNIANRQDVTRVPLEAIRWAGNEAFAAVASPSRTSWEWRRVELGLSDSSYVEVTSGLKPGDQVVATPDHLPAPHVNAAPAVAGTVGRPRG